MTNLEIFGYCASIVLLCSYLTNNMVKLRLVNTVACAMFTVYGIFHHAYPIVVVNVMVIIVNAYYLLKK